MNTDKPTDSSVTVGTDAVKLARKQNQKHWPTDKVYFENSYCATSSCFHKLGTFSAYPSSLIYTYLTEYSFQIEESHIMWHSVLS